MRNLPLPSHLIKDILTREVSNGDTDEGVDPCAEHDRLFNPAEGKSKLDYVLDDVDDSSVRFMLRYFERFIFLFDR